MLGPRWRLLGIAAAGTAAFALPAALVAAPSPSVARLQGEQRSLAQQKRSAVLDLYSLDARLKAAYARVAALQRSERALRAERAALSAELRLARVDAQISQRELAARVRSLYDHGSTSMLELIFGAHSLTEAMTELDNLNRLTSVDHQILLQVRSARVREVQARAKLAARQRRLAAAVRQASDEARTLAAVRTERSAYLGRLSARADLTARQLSQVESRAKAAEAKAERLTQAPPAATVASPVVARTTQAIGTRITVVSTGYCLGGTTATGLPVGWGVAAVDPAVIPLGTRLTIPGYGEAVAADTGGAIVGPRIDLWFPTCVRAGGWGSRSVTIVLH